MSFLFWRGRGSLISARPRLQNRRGGAIELSSRIEHGESSGAAKSGETTRRSWTEVTVTGAELGGKQVRNRKLFATSTSTYLCFLAVSGIGIAQREPLSEPRAAFQTPSCFTGKLTVPSPRGCRSFGVVISEMGQIHLSFMSLVFELLVQTRDACGRTWRGNSSRHLHGVA